MVPYITQQLIVTLCVFVAGFAIGLILRSGGTNWKRMYRDEHAAHVALRRDYDAHLARHVETRTGDHDTLRAGSF